MLRRTWCETCDNVTADDTRFKCHCTEDGTRLLTLSGCSCGVTAAHKD